MSGFKKFFDNIIFKGGILAAGVSFMFLCRKNIYPEFTGPLFYTFTTLGFMAILSHLLRQKEDPYTYKKLPISFDFASDASSEDSTTYNARMAEFQMVKPNLLRMIREQKQLFDEAQKLTEDRDRLEEWLEDSQRIEERMRVQQAQRQRSQPEGEPEAARQPEGEADSEGEPEATRQPEGEADSEGEPEATREPEGEPEADSEGEPEDTREHEANSEVENEVEMAAEATEEFNVSD